MFSNIEQELKQQIVLPIEHVFKNSSFHVECLYGAQTQDLIATHLYECDIAVVLLCDEYLLYDSCRKELATLLYRGLTESGSRSFTFIAVMMRSLDSTRWPAPMPRTKAWPQVGQMLGFTLAAPR